MTIFAKRINLINNIMEIMKNHDFEKGLKYMYLSVLTEIKSYELTCEELPAIRLDWLFTDLEKALMPTQSRIEDEAEKLDLEMGRRNPRRRRDDDVNDEHVKSDEDKKIDGMDSNTKYEEMKRAWIMWHRSEAETKKLQREHEELMAILEDF